METVFMCWDQVFFLVVFFYYFNSSMCACNWQAVWGTEKSLISINSMRQGWPAATRCSYGGYMLLGRRHWWPTAVKWIKTILTIRTRNRGWEWIRKGANWSELKPPRGDIESADDTEHGNFDRFSFQQNRTNNMATLPTESKSYYDWFVSAFNEPAQSES